MKTFFLTSLLFVVGLVAYGQQDTALVNRINQMLTLTQKKDLEKIMDYT